MLRTGIAVACALLWATVVTSAARPLPAPPRPGASVVLYVVDTLRADRLGLHGYDLATSPRLDRLAARGRIFERAYAPGPSTKLTVPALLASRHPVEMNGQLAPQPGERVLAEAFRAAGYATAGFQANFGLIAELGYGRGFDVYRTLQHRDGESRRYWNAREVNAAALEWVSSLPPDRPFFLWVQIMDVHFPYAPPPRYHGTLHPLDSPARRERHALMQKLLDGTHLTHEQREVFGRNLESMDVERYDEVIAWATDEFVRFFGRLRRLDRLDDAIVVLTADHGEPLGDHGTLVHGTNLHEEQVRVPLVVWGPGVPPGREHGLVSLVDLAPTLLDLTGLEAPASFRGQSLARDETAGADRAVVGELLTPRTFDSPAARYLRQGDWKLIADPTKTRLFDLATDPRERRDVSADHPDVVSRLRAELERRLPSTAPGDGAAASTTTLPAPVRRELRESLRALGYAE